MGHHLGRGGGGSSQQTRMASECAKYVHVDVGWIKSSQAQNYLVAVVSPCARRTGVGTVRSAEAGRTHAESGDLVAPVTSTAVARRSAFDAVVSARTRTITGHTSPPSSADTRATHVVARGTVLTAAPTTTSHAERSRRTFCNTHLLTYCAAYCSSVWWKHMWNKHKVNASWCRSTCLQIIV